MRKALAIFFLAVILVAQTPLQQLLRLPVLIEHYREHRAEMNSISFLDFLQLHYFSGNPKDKDYDRDMQLPFRASDVVLLSGIVEVPEDFQVDLAAPVYKEQVYPLFDCTRLPSSHAHSIWQPPKVG